MFHADSINKKFWEEKVLLADDVKFFNDQYGQVPAHSEYIIQLVRYLFSSVDITESTGEVTANGN
jgi:hypothetical protein